ncbi:hypothetical protein D3C73_1494940 [compost metagenome]
MNIGYTGFLQLHDTSFTKKAGIRIQLCIDSMAGAVLNNVQTILKSQGDLTARQAHPLQRR